MILSKNDRISVLLAKNATEREYFAAEELKDYLFRMTGAQTVLTSEKQEPAGPCFILGGPERNEAAETYISRSEFSGLFSGEEGFVLRSFGENTILIAGCEGSCERGTVYGVYEFLERYCGCSLSAYSHPDADIGEWVPQYESLALPEISYVKPCADRPVRCACVQYGDSAGNPERALNDAFFRWLIKNRYNSIYLWTKNYEQLKKLGVIERTARYGLEFMVGHHDVLDLFLPIEGNAYFPEKYYETHPEYFRLQADGSRFFPKDHWGQIIVCCRNEELIEQISRNIILWLKQNPEIRMLQIAPHDGHTDQCVCPRCAPYGKAENFTYFTNEITKRVTAVFPKVNIVQMVYSDLWDCPENVELSPNLMILEATWHGGLRHFGKPDGSGLIGTDFDTNIRKWQKTGARTLFYEYYMGVYQNRQRFIPMADEIQAIWQYYVRQGIDGASTQIECFNLWNNLFNFYCFGRTGYDTSLSMEDNLSRFTKLFGEGGEEVSEVIRLAEDCVDGQADIKTGGLYFLEHIDWEQVYSLFDRALAKTKAPRARNNLRMMRMALRYTDVEAQQINGKYIQPGPEFQSVRPFDNIDRELLYMTEFDSYWKNDPGYGIDIPVKAGSSISEKPFDPEQDPWYCFE